MEKSVLFRLLTQKVDEIVNNKQDRDENLKAICKLLKDNVSYYDWVGFYIVDEKRQNELLLGPFEGQPTEHVRIPFGRGICGQAAELRKTFIVQEVSRETNYLSCNPNVRSEIVSPILRKGEVVGELDIDSHAQSPFTDEDEAFLKKIGEMVSKLFRASGRDACAQPNSTQNNRDRLRLIFWCARLKAKPRIRTSF